MADSFCRSHLVTMIAALSNAIVALVFQRKEAEMSFMFSSSGVPHPRIDHAARSLTLKIQTDCEVFEVEHTDGLKVLGVMMCPRASTEVMMD